VEQTERALKGMLALAHSPSARGKKPDRQAAWKPPIQRTVALDGRGVPELAQAIGRHAAYLQKSGEWGKRDRLRLEFELESRLAGNLLADFHSRVGEARYSEAIEAMLRRRLSPGEAVSELLKI
jgi:LAO/AO transport system kinase